MATFKFRYRVDSFTEEDEATLYGQVLKACTKCHRILFPNDFYKSHDHKSGIESQCKKCTDEKNKAYFKTEKGKAVQREVTKKSNGSEKRKQCAREHAQSDKFKDTQKAYRSSDQYRETLKRHYQTPEYKEKRKKFGRSEKCRLKGARYRQSDSYKERMKSEKHKEQVKKYKEKRLQFEGERLRCSISRYIAYSLRGKKNGRKWESLVGYDLKELMIHLEKQFTEGMSWENYGMGKGKWTVDHIIPHSAFGYISSSDLDFKRCWALENLRPMWGAANASKADKIIKQFQPSLDVVLYKGEFNDRVYGTMM